MDHKAKLVKINDESRKQFSFDTLVGSDSSQDGFYNKLGIDTYINKVLEGFHCTVFAYGQTGSGKTYSMQGDINSNDNIGITQRAVNRLFTRIEEETKANPNKRFTVSVSYLQLYNEKVYDLLNENNVTTEHGLKMRYNKDNFVVENLFIFECNSPSEVLSLFKLGQKNKVTASHAMNMNSSRSHTIFSIQIESAVSNDVDSISQSKL